MPSASEHIEKPMAETTIQEKIEKEKRQRDELESEQVQEIAKRRELSPTSKDRKPELINLPANPSPRKSGFASAIGFASIRSKSNVFDQAPADYTVSAPAESTTTQESQSSTAPATSSAFSGFAKSSAFSSATSGGFSSFTSSQGTEAGAFSSLLNTSNKSSSIFDVATSSTDLATKKSVSHDRENSDDEEEEEAEAVDEEQYIAVKGLSKTQVPTGEETETCLHQVRAKLFAIDPKDTAAGWKERGTGTLRVLQSDTSEDSPEECKSESRRTKARTRLVMRADAVLRVILNMPLHHKYTVQPGGESMGDKTIRIFGVEDGVGTWFAIKVGSKDAAEDLMEVITNGMRLSLESSSTNEIAENTSTSTAAKASSPNENHSVAKIADAAAQDRETPRTPDSQQNEPVTTETTTSDTNENSSVAKSVYTAPVLN